MSARRFPLAYWLHDVSQELATLAGTNVSNSAACTEPDEAGSKRRLLEDFHRQLLAELTGSSTWLPRQRAQSRDPTQIRRRHSTELEPLSSPNLFDADAAPSFCIYTGCNLIDEARRKAAAKAHLAALHLADERGFSLSFDVLCSHIFKLLCDSSVHIRTRALKGLSSMVSACDDCTGPPLSNCTRVITPLLLNNSASVREAAVDFVGHLLVARPELIDVYYAPLTDRILDRSVSVRKRAIRSLRALLSGDVTALETNQLLDSLGRPSCLKRLSLKQLNDVCVKLIRRLHDEDTVNKLVLDIFFTLWFTAFPEQPDGSFSPEDARLLDDRVMCICEVILTFRNRGFHIMEEFMTTILNVESAEKSAIVDKACTQIVNYLIKNIQNSLGDKSDANVSLNESATTTDSHSQLHHHQQHKIKHSHDCLLYHRRSRHRTASREPSLSSDACTCPVKRGLLQIDTKGDHSFPTSDTLPTSGCLATLHLIAKCRPILVLSHCPLLASILHHASSESTLPGLESNALFHSAGTIEACALHLSNVKQTLPPDWECIFPDGISQFNDDLIGLLQRHYRIVVDSALACLAAVVNHLSKDYRQVTCCFAQFYGNIWQQSARRRFRLPDVLRRAGVACW